MKEFLKLILNVYDHSFVMHSFITVPSVIEELLLGMGIAKKIVSRYITIRDQRIVIRITIRITRFNLSVRMVPLCFQLK